MEVNSSTAINSQQQALLTIHFCNKNDQLSANDRIELIYSTIIQVRFDNDWQKANFIVDVCKITEYKGKIAEICDLWMNEINSIEEKKTEPGKLKKFIINSNKT